MENTPDTEITLTRAGWELHVSPYGASLRGLIHDGSPVITAYTGAQNKVGGQGDVLIPFPGRVAGGKYTFAGTSYQMDLNDKETPSAIHGFLRQTLWDVAAQSAGSVAFTTTLAPDAHPGYPFALAVSVTYALSESGLTTSFEIENTGDTPAPVAAGFHPYFTVSSPLINTDTLHVPFASYLEFKDLIPTGNVLPVSGTEFDFRQPHVLGETVLNICYLHPSRDADGLLRIRLSDDAAQTAVTVWMDAAFEYVVLYSGDPLPDDHRRKSLAIEPMTCGADAFNHAQWGLVTLVPGETLTGSWGVAAE
jgi:aldose 1-epimerase